MKVKVFETRQKEPNGAVSGELEDAMNEWLAEHAGLIVVDVRTTVVPAARGDDAAGTLVCMVFYEHRPGPGDRRAGFLGFAG